MKNNEKTRLTAPIVDSYVERLHRNGLESYPCSQETYAMLPALFAEVMKISPYKSKNVARRLHFRADRGPIEDFGDYDELHDVGEVENRAEFEELWKEFYPDEKHWFTVEFFEEDGFQAVWINNKLIISYRSDSKPTTWGMDARELISWLTDEVIKCQREILNGTYNDTVAKELPPGHRYGTLTRKALWEICPGEKEEYFANLPEADREDFLKLMAETDEDETPSGYLPEMTSGLFFRCCELGYRANKYKKCGELSPQELYLKHADGRDEGLRDVPEDSADAFSKWYFDRERCGGHPWEVCRGGNSTHVSLYVRHSDQGFFFSVEGRSWGRSVETINFYLAIRRAGYPIVIRDGKKLAPRLTGTERIGVVPDGVFPCYCESSFNDDSIIDYINLPHTDREIWAKHCVWFPEPELRLL